MGYVTFQFNDSISFNTKCDTKQNQSLAYIYYLWVYFFDITIKVIYFTINIIIGWINFFEKHYIWQYHNKYKN